MTGWYVIASVAIVTLGAVLAASIWATAWQTVQIKRTDNFVAVNRDGFAAQRNIIRDQSRTQEHQ